MSVIICVACCVAPAGIPTFSRGTTSRSLNDALLLLLLRSTVAAGVRVLTLVAVVRAIGLRSSGHVLATGHVGVGGLGHRLLLLLVGRRGHRRGAVALRLGGLLATGAAGLQGRRLLPRTPAARDVVRLNGWRRWPATVLSARALHGGGSPALVEAACGGIARRLRRVDLAPACSLAPRTRIGTAVRLLLRLVGVRGGWPVGRLLGGWGSAAGAAGTVVALATRRRCWRKD